MQDTSIETQNLLKDNFPSQNLPKSSLENKRREEKSNKVENEALGMYSQFKIDILSFQARGKNVCWKFLQILGNQSVFWVWKFMRINIFFNKIENSRKKDK